MHSSRCTALHRRAQAAYCHKLPHGCGSQQADFHKRCSSRNINKCLFLCVCVFVSALLPSNSSAHYTCSQLHTTHYADKIITSFGFTSEHLKLMAHHSPTRVEGQKRDVLGKRCDLTAPFRHEGQGLCLSALGRRDRARWPACLPHTEATTLVCCFSATRARANDVWKDTTSHKFPVSSVPTQRCVESEKVLAQFFGRRRLADGFNITTTRRSCRYSVATVA